MWAMSVVLPLIMWCLAVDRASNRADDLSGASRLDDRIGHAQVLQAVARAHERRRLAGNDRGEVLDLVRERIFALNRLGSRPERLEPRPVLLLLVVPDPHRGNTERSRGADDGVSVLVLVGRIRLVLLRRLLPALR